MVEEHKHHCLTSLETSVAAMFSVFVKHQNVEGKLTKEKFLSMLKTELPSFVENTPVNEETIFERVDLDKDGSVNFEEFGILVCGIAKDKHDVLQGMIKCMEQLKAKE